MRTPLAVWLTHQRGAWPSTLVCAASGCGSRSAGRSTLSSAVPIVQMLEQRRPVALADGWNMKFAAPAQTRWAFRVRWPFRRSGVSLVAGVILALAQLTAVQPTAGAVASSAVPSVSTIKRSMSGSGSWSRWVGDPASPVGVDPSTCGSDVPVAQSVERMAASYHGRVKGKKRYYGSVQVQVARFVSAVAAQGALSGLRDWVRACPRSEEWYCTECDDGFSARRSVAARRRVGEQSVAWNERRYGLGVTNGHVIAARTGRTVVITYVAHSGNPEDARVPKAPSWARTVAIAKKAVRAAGTGGTYVPPVPPPPGLPPPPDWPPDAVPGFRSDRVTPTSVRLAWTNPADPEIAAVEIRRDGILLYAGLATSTLDTGLSPGRTYTYTARARDNSGRLGVTSSLSVALPLPDGIVGSVTRVSVDAQGAQINAGSGMPVFSSDGLQVAFDSDGALVANDTNGVSDIYVKTLSTGAIVRVSTDEDGNQANAPSQSPAFSPDGTRIAFSSLASDLVPGDTNNFPDIFVKDLASGSIARVSTTSDGSQAPAQGADPQWHQGSIDPQFSPTGQEVLFISGAGNLVPEDGNREFDVFVKSLVDGSVTLVSADDFGFEGYAGSREATFSPDGRQVLFSSAAWNLVPGDTNGITDVFVKDLETGKVRLVSTASDGSLASGENTVYWGAVWSADGGQVAFHSNSPNLVASDTNGVVDVFVKDLTTGAVRRVSTAEDGTQWNWGSNGATFSPDGVWIAFTSDGAELAGGGVLRGASSYVKNLVTGQVLLASTDEEGVAVPGGVYVSQYSPAGASLLLEGYGALTGDDSNGTTDIYIKSLS